MPISVRELSIVICGPLEPQTDLFIGTKQVVDQTRRWFPEAEIVLATWKSCSSGVRASECKADRVVIARDPGPIELVKLSGEVHYSNFLRMVAAGDAALRSAGRRYCLRVRSDCAVSGAGMLEIYNQQVLTLSKSESFRQRVLIPALYTRNPRKGGRPFHPSDMLHLGLRLDIAEIFQAGVNGRYFRRRLLFQEGSGLLPEQMLWLSYLESKGKRVDIKYEHVGNPITIYKASQMLLSEFIIADQATLQISFKKQYQTMHGANTCYTESEFKRDCNIIEKKPVLFAIVAVLPAAIHWYLILIRYKCWPLLADWSAAGRKWKVQLVKGVAKRIAEGLR